MITSDYSSHPVLVLLQAIFLCGIRIAPNRETIVKNVAPMGGATKNLLGGGVQG